MAPTQSAGARQRFLSDYEATGRLLEANVQLGNIGWLSTSTVDVQVTDEPGSFRKDKPDHR